MAGKESIKWWEEHFFLAKNEYIWRLAIGDCKNGGKRCNQKQIKPAPHRSPIYLGI
jgi:hypothetical protein